MSHESESWRIAPPGSEELDRLLALAPDDESPLSAAELNQATAFQMAGVEPPSRAQIRLSGDSVKQNSVAIRTATSALSSLQEAVTSIGAALSDSLSLFGQVSNSIRSATELRLTPTVLPGSVIFNAVPSAEGEADNEDLLDRSIDRLFEIISNASSDSVGEGDLVDAIKLVGPRAAKHLRALSDLLAAEGVLMNIDWHLGSEPVKRSVISARSANFLRDVISRNAVKINERQLRGDLTTVSLDEPAVLRLQSGEKIPLRTTEEQSQSFGPLFGKQVEVVVEEETSVSLTTGRETATYRLVSIAEVQPELDSSVGVIPHSEG